MRTVLSTDIRWAWSSDGRSNDGSNRSDLPNADTIPDQCQIMDIRRRSCSSRVVYATSGEAMTPANGKTVVGFRRRRERTTETAGGSTVAAHLAMRGRRQLTEPTMGGRIVLTKTELTECIPCRTRSTMPFAARNA
jgi:hypothetical protein